MFNRFSTKNRMLYRLKCLNTRNKEFIELEDNDNTKIQYKK